MFEEYEQQLKTVFKYFSKKAGADHAMTEDVTLEVADAINMFQKAKIIDGNLVTIEAFVQILERYYTPGTRLEDKLDQKNFDEYLAANPLILPVNQDIKSRNERMAERQLKLEELEKKRAAAAAEAEDGAEPAVIEDDTIPEEEPEMEEEVKKEREESEKVQALEQWRSDTISSHLIYIKGVEIIFFEFKEIVLALAVKLREQVDPKTGKLKVVLTTFIEDWLMRRLSSFVKFQIPTNKAKSATVRKWPESQRDLDIKALTKDKLHEQEEQRRRQEMQEREQAEQALMAAEDYPALDPAELEAMRRKQIEEEEAARRAREAEEEEVAESDDEEESDDERLEDGEDD